MAQGLGVSVPTVSKWRERFAFWGLRGLLDQPRPGKPVTCDAAFRNRVLALLEQPRPPGMSYRDLNPPVNALVLSVDEKPSLQAIERPAGYVETDSGAVVRALKSTYKRHGTLNLVAALRSYSVCCSARPSAEPVLKNKDQLREAIEAFIKKHNQSAKPFRWRKREVKGSQLRNSIVNLCN